MSEDPVQASLSDHGVHMRVVLQPAFENVEDGNDASTQTIRRTRHRLYGLPQLELTKAFATNGLSHWTTMGIQFPGMESNESELKLFRQFCGTPRFGPASFNSFILIRLRIC